MKTFPQILIVLLLIIKNFAQELEIQEITKDYATTNEELEAIQYITTEHSITNVILEITPENLTDTSIKSKEIEENSTTTIKINNDKLFAEQTGNEEIQTILNDLTNHQDEIKDISKKSSESVVDVIATTTSIPEESKDIAEKSTENRIDETTTTVNNLNENKDISEKSTESLNDVTTDFTNKQEESKDKSEKSTENRIDETTTTVSNLEENKDISEKSTESLVDVTATPQNKPEQTKDISETSTEYLISEKSTELLVAETTSPTTVDYEPNTTPLNTLEDYAVKQMNFILDHLLMETQEFVATVLQASVNTVFQRDYLKRYAEGLNRLLNPDTDSEYSDEIIEDTKVMTQDELYEEIVTKLNFLKSKPSKYLQRHLPRDWIHEYRNKRAELAIWLDKASEQMHREFNRFVSEEEDHIKYQYFSEAFDDISRATEIHHKLALLADLVKIVKNKKQITFMDLYMQT
ncbi:uncharacterized protein LOC135951867 [Calliphora vicina]|uniref:uncharacterized protein LOC135951867 n=1 Tax=Calliphora vicina TaxID=7373 RepID=UPI00325C2E9F